MRRNRGGLNRAALYISRRRPILRRTITSAWLHTHCIMWTLLRSLLLTAWLTECHPFGHPHVQLGDTTIIGKYLQPSKLEFFGGYGSLILIRLPPHPCHLQVSLLLSLQLTSSASLPRGLSIPSHPCDHLTLVITVRHAYSPPSLLYRGPQSPLHRNCLQICQRTVSISMYSDLPVLILTHRCLSWSGFMGEDSNVRGGCLYFLVVVSLFRQIQCFPQMVLLSYMTDLLSSNNL